jgi:hypothetical protein
MTYMDKPVSLPRMIQAGLSYRVFEFLTLEADTRYGLVDPKFGISLGSEFRLAKMASFRLGYSSRRQADVSAANDKSGLNALGGISMGVGLQLFSRMNLDYAFVPMGDLGNQHHMSLRWRFQ